MTDFEQPSAVDPALAGQDLVEVANFFWPGEAQLALSLLRSEAVPCYLQNENVLRMDWLYTNGLGGLRLMVPLADAEQAREILGAMVSDEELEKEVEASMPAGPPE